MQNCLECEIANVFLSPHNKFVPFNYDHLLIVSVNDRRIVAFAAVKICHQWGNVLGCGQPTVNMIANVQKSPRGYRGVGRRMSIIWKLSRKIERLNLIKTMKFLPQDKNRIIIMYVRQCYGEFFRKWDEEKRRGMFRHGHEGMFRHEQEGKLIHRHKGMFRHEVLLLHDNAPFHRINVVQAVLLEAGFDQHPQPPYSPDLTPSDVFVLCYSKF